MGWDRTDAGRRGRYHHGNLREALIEAALGFIGAKGAASLTMAELARAAAVSPAAPYRHFRDRDDVLAALAKRGFTTFSAALRAAWSGGQPDATGALIRVGRAYLDFARLNPALYTAMFEAGLPMGNHPDLCAVADEAFDMVREAAAACVAELPAERRPPVLMVALHVWTQAHGVASLFGRDNKGGRTIPMPPEDLLEAGLRIYLDGLRQSGA